MGAPVDICEISSYGLATAVIIKVSTLSSTSGNSGLIADSFKPPGRGKNLGTWDILVNFRTGLLLYSLRYLCLLKFNPKYKCDFMLLYFILLGEEVGWGGGDERLPSLKKPPDPGGAQKCFIRGGSGLALFFTISNQKRYPFLIPLLIKSITFTYLL